MGIFNWFKKKQNKNRLTMTSKLELDRVNIGNYPDERSYLEEAKKFHDGIITLSCNEFSIRKGNKIIMRSCMTLYETGNYCNIYIGNWPDKHPFRIACLSDQSKEFFKLTQKTEIITFGSMQSDGYAVTFRLLPFDGSTSEEETVSMPKKTNSQYPQYKEDKYSLLVESASNNPYNITNNRLLNDKITWMNMTNYFKNELESLLLSCKDRGVSETNMVVTYVNTSIKSWYDNAGYVPKAIVDAIIEETYAALQQTRYANIINDLDSLKEKVYRTLIH